MSNAFPVTPHSPLEDRRAEVDRINAAEAQYFKVSGLIKVVGIGDAQARVAFPVNFVDKPVLHFGGELDYGQPTRSFGSFPTWSASVLTWNFLFKPDGAFVYVGAILGIVVTGLSSQIMNIHWSVEGIGLRTPSGTDD